MCFEQMSQEIAVLPKSVGNLYEESFLLYIPQIHAIS